MLSLHFSQMINSTSMKWYTIYITMQIVFFKLFPIKQIPLLNADIFQNTTSNHNVHSLFDSCVNINASFKSVFQITKGKFITILVDESFLLKIFLTGCKWPLIFLNGVIIQIFKGNAETAII